MTIFYFGYTTWNSFMLNSSVMVKYRLICELTYSLELDSKILYLKGKIIITQYSSRKFVRISLLLKALLFKSLNLKWGKCFSGLYLWDEILLRLSDSRFRVRSSRRICLCGEVKVPKRWLIERRWWGYRIDLSEYGNTPKNEWNNEKQLPTEPN